MSGAVASAGPEGLGDRRRRLQPAGHQELSAETSQRDDRDEVHEAGHRSPRDRSGGAAARPGDPPGDGQEGKQRHEGHEHDRRSGQRRDDRRRDQPTDVAVADDDGRDDLDDERDGDRDRQRADEVGGGPRATGEDRQRIGHGDRDGVDRRQAAHERRRIRKSVRCVPSIGAVSWISNRRPKAARNPASRVVLEHVLTGRQQALDHRVLARDELDDQVRPESCEQVRRGGQWHVPADRQVVDQRQREDDVRVRAVQHRAPLRERPAEGRARLRDVAEERQDRGRAFPPDGPIVAFRRRPDRCPRPRPGARAPRRSG